MSETETHRDSGSGTAGDLATWLREQIAEDEKAARKRLHYAQQNHLMLQDPQYLGRVIPGWHEWPEIEAAAAHALAECEAKRRIVAEHGEGRPWSPAQSPGRCRVCTAIDQHGSAARFHAPCPTLRLLALPYQRRPGYREEWRPVG